MTDKMFSKSDVEQIAKQAAQQATADVNISNAQVVALKVAESIAPIFARAVVDAMAETAE
jgi:hypothetical protein